MYSKEAARADLMCQKDTFLYDRMCALGHTLAGSVSQETLGHVSLPPSFLLQGGRERKSVLYTEDTLRTGTSLAALHTLRHINPRTWK